MENGTRWWHDQHTQAPAPSTPIELVHGTLITHDGFPILRHVANTVTLRAHAADSESRHQGAILGLTMEGSPMPSVDVPRRNCVLQILSFGQG